MKYTCTCGGFYPTHSPNQKHHQPQCNVFTHAFKEFTLEEQIREALCHPIGDDSFVTHPLAKQVLEMVKKNVDLELNNINQYRQGVLEGLAQGRRITKYHIAAKPYLRECCKSMVQEVDLFLEANIERGGYDSTTPLDDMEIK